MFESPFRNNRSCRFVIDPLDIGISGMQLELIENIKEYIEKDLSDPFSVSFQSKNPMLKIGWLKLDGFLVDEAMKEYRLTLTIWEKDGTQNKRHTLCEGPLPYILEYTNSNPTFFQDCKGWALHYDEMLSAD